MTGCPVAESSRERMLQQETSAVQRWIDGMTEQGVNGWMMTEVITITGTITITITIIIIKSEHYSLVTSRLLQCKGRNLTHISTCSL